MEKVQRFVLDQQSWVSGVSAAITAYLRLEGRVEEIEVKINDNTGDKTLTLNIKSLNGATLFNKAGIPEAQTNRYSANSEKNTRDAYFNAFLVDEKCTLTLTPSGDPSTSGMTADVVIYTR